MADAKLRVNLLGDASSLNRSLKTASARLDKFGKNISDVGKDLSLKLTLPIVAAGGAAIKMASDMEESQNKVRVAFGDSSRSVEAFAKTTLDSFGIAESSALDMTALFGDMATGMGVSQSEAASLSTSLVGLAGDLSSFKNINIDEVTTALSGVFTGETESLKRLGIVMTEVNLEQFALQEGIQKSIKEMTQQEKIMLRLNYIFSVTKNAQGDFARTQDGAANQTRKLQQGIKELAAEIGENLLPKYTKIVTKLNEYISQFKAADEETQNMIITFSGIVAATPPVLIALGAIAKGIAAVSRAARYLASEAVLGRLKKAILGTFGTVAASATAAVIALDQLTKQIAPDANLFDRIGQAAKGIFNPLAAITGLMGLQIKNSPVAQLSQDIADFEFDMIMEEADALDAFIESVNKPKDKPKGSVINMDQLEADISEFEDLMAYGDAVAAKYGIEEMDKGDTSLTYNLAKDEAAVNSFADTIKSTADKFKYPLEQINEDINKLSEGAAAMLMRVGNALQGAFTQIMEGKNPIKALGNAIMDLVKQLIAAAAASAIVASIISSITGTPFKASFGVTFNALSGLPAFANGGIVSSPTLGLVGEYSGARSNPEVIAPLDRLKSMLSDLISPMNSGIISAPTMGMMNQNSGSGFNTNPIPALDKLQSLIGMKRQDVNVTGQFRLEGQDLVVAVERANNQRSNLIG